MNKGLMIAGAAVVGLGLLLLLGGALGLGKLPGDIAIKRGNTRVYVPIVSCIVLSVVLSLIFAALSRR